MKIPSFAIFKSSGIIRNVKWSFDFKEEGEFPEFIEFIEVIAVVEDKKFPPAKYETCRDCIKRVEKSDMLKLLRLWRLNKESEIYSLFGYLLNSKFIPNFVSQVLSQWGVNFHVLLTLKIN